MFENWQEMVRNNQKRLLNKKKQEKSDSKNQKSTNLYGTKIEQIFIDDIDIWKKKSTDNRESASGITFKEDKK